MMFFSLLDPIDDSMRGLCEASKLNKSQRRTGLPKVSLGNFSEAQGVFDPKLLCAVLRHRLMEPGVVYVCDHNHSGDYDLLPRMDEVGAAMDKAAAP